MGWWRKDSSGVQPSAASPETAAPADEDDRERLVRIASTHLDQETAARWLALLRPAVRLDRAGTGDPVVARLGGDPRVPDDFVWPVWDDKGPLTFIAEVDLRALAALGVDHGLGLPEEGRLLAFYFDGSVDEGVEVVGPWDVETLEGARLVHLATAREDHPPCRAPDPLAGYPEIELTGHLELTDPGWEHPVLQRALQPDSLDDEAWMQHPVVAAEFLDAVAAVGGPGPRHRIGGWASPVQGPVEYEAAAIAGRSSYPANDADEALRWSLLLQVDTDDNGMMWGDVGTLYWLTREGQAPGDALQETAFTWQCS